MKKMNKSFYILILLTLIVLLNSCSSTRNLPEGELLYIGATVKIESDSLSKKQKKQIRKELENLIRPKPNKKFLGLRPKLFFYNLAGETTKDKGFKHWLKYKVGEAPVLFSQVDMPYNADLLKNYSENNGYFLTTVSFDSIRKKKKANVIYTVNPKQQFKIRNITFPDDSTQIVKEINKTKQRSLLKSGNAYNLEIIKSERNRIDERLKEKGFYYFNPNYIKVQVDSTVGNYMVDLKVVIKDETPNNATQVYTIDDIIIYPNYSITDSIKNQTTKIKTYKDFTIIDPENTFKPRVFDRALYFERDDIYNRSDHNLSLNRLVNLGTFKFVKNQFIVSDSLKNQLDVYYYLTPLPKKSFRVEILGKTNSANYTGSELNINWSNRNTFKGAELLTLTAFGGIEAQVSGQNKGFNVYRIGGEANLIWPRFIAPLSLKSSSGFVPKTKATLGYEFQERSKLYSLNTFKGSFGYLWKENIRKEHQLNISEITYASPLNVTPLYESQILENPSLEKVIEKQLIFGPTYAYTYTNTMQKRKKNTIYFKGAIDLSGNIAGLMMGSNAKKDKTEKIFDVPFSQFTKLELEFRHYLRINENTQLASRMIIGNSYDLPFIKQFFIGGTNSIRAFRARSIGPGTFDSRNTNASFLPDQSGDVKLELNTEYRTNLFSIINGAVFIDAGNIWLINDDINKPGAQFSSKFYEEIAVGAGFGLRFDLSFLILRTDLAFPLRVPYNEKGNRWVIDEISFGNSTWRKNNLVFNLAIGYPF